MTDDHTHDDMIWRREAQRRVLTLRNEAIDGRMTESASSDAVVGRTLAEPVVAERNRPPRDHATMDGFALDATDEYPLRIRNGEVFPEDDPPSIDSIEAVRIATGAPLPEDANAVLKREDATVDNGRLRGNTVEPGTYTYERGSNVTAGETLFAAGERLTPKDAVLLRDIGIEEISVYQPFNVGILATGTEIHEGRTADLDSPMLAGLVRSWGHEATCVGTVPDERERVESHISTLSEEYDAVLTTGGTSVGNKDYVIQALSALGEIDFHRVRVRPGKPFAAARLPEHDTVAFAVPGKPVGAHIIATLVLRPFFVGKDYLATVDATLVADVGIDEAGFEYAVPVLLDEDGDDTTAVPFGHTDSPLGIYEETFDPSVLSSSSRATQADGFVLMETDVTADETVRVVPYPVVE